MTFVRRWFDRRRRWPVSGVALCFTLGASSLGFAQHHGDIEVRSTLPGSGQLATAFDFAPTVPVFESLCAVGACLYSNTDPGFVTPSDAGDGLHPLAAGTAVSLQVVSIDDGASVKIGTAILDAPGEEAVLGTALSMHRHPSWQAQAPEGEVRSFDIVFTLTTSSGEYAASEPMTIRLSNFAGTTTSTSTLALPSTTVTSTTTMTVPPTTSTTLVTTTTTLTPWPLCGDANDDGVLTATDALRILRVAVGLDDCAVCVCDVDASGGMPAITAGDALRALRAAVGTPDSALVCPACE